MTEFTEAGRQAGAELASRHGVSPDAIEHVLMAVIAGQGTLAQFDHPELGGMGQWSLGGMTMVGDMFNNTLKARVDAICTDVAQLLGQSSPLHLTPAASSQTQSQGDGVSLFVSGGASGHWWPGDLGHAASTGAQNRMRYAWFPDARRLAIDAGDGKVRIYDTGDHRIGGFSQQQSGDQSLSFTSQHGLVKLSELREIDAAGLPGNEHAGRSSAPALSDALLKTTASNRVADAAPEPSRFEPGTAQPELRQREPDEPAKPATAEPPVTADTPVAADTSEQQDIFAKIERLAALHAKGILTDGEYQAKKAELLARI
ncbi:MAG: SHOCT domain-containing protein [Hoeflea sp.]|uniref:SHOCT domain-containing protein n=1 Tax=Hoeflea sp. TaxID=1940281 RepID=UPI003296C9EB